MSIQPIREDFSYLTESKKELLKKTFGNGLTNDELDLFGYVCKQTGLDPFIKQIYPIKRRSKNKDGTWDSKLTIQVGIDGLRSIAERTGNYCPGKENTYTYDKDGHLLSATAYIKKRTSDGKWHEISATAFMCEYRPEAFSAFWNDKPHIMLGKCAEALLIRKAFPAVTANLYISEEMARATEPIEINEIVPDIQSQPETQIIDSKANERSNIGSPLNDLINELKNVEIPCNRLEEWIKLRCQTKNISPEECVTACLAALSSFKASYVKWLNSALVESVSA